MMYSMTAVQFRYFGILQVAYLKVRMQDDKTIFMVFAANGTLLGRAEERENAVEIVVEAGLNFVTVH
jgi:hypothetical protein